MATTPTPGSALWQPQAHMPSVPGDRLTIVAGEGANIQTDDGRWLLDATAALWYANIGHGRERLADAAAAQMRKLETYHTFGRIVNQPALDLADRVAAMSPIENTKVFWVSGGSDAVDTAAKLARRVWQIRGQANKRIIISRHSSYHGLHAFGTSLAGIPVNREGYGAESLIPETALVPANDADALEAEIRTLGADRVAAFFAEPVIGTGGVIFPTDDYLRRAEAICRDNDILFVCDEVITGFGRTGEMFASETFGVTPDMITIAKGITSGYAALGGVLAGERVWGPFFDTEDAPIFRHGVTYSGHATACAVAQANLDILEEEDLVARVAELTPVLAAAVAPLADHPLVVGVRTGAGLLAGVELRPEVSGDALMRICIDDGILLRILTGNIVQISPPFVVDTDDLQRIAAGIGRALDQLAS